MTIARIDEHMEKLTFIIALEIIKSYISGKEFVNT